MVWHMSAIMMPHTHQFVLIHGFASQTWQQADRDVHQTREEKFFGVSCTMMDTRVRICLASVAHDNALGLGVVCYMGI